MPQTPLRIGLIGAGLISNLHLPHLLTLGADVYVYSEVGAAEIVAQHGGTVVDSLDELLDKVDYVDVATPTYPTSSSTRPSRPACWATSPCCGSHARVPSRRARPGSPIVPSPAASSWTR